MVEELIEARGRLVDAEERLRQKQRERPRRTEDPVAIKLRERANKLELDIDELEVQAEQKTVKPEFATQRVKIMHELLQKTLDRLNRRKALYGEAEEKHTHELIQLRKKMIAEEER